MNVEHTKTDGLPGLGLGEVLDAPAFGATRNERMASHKIECNACPVLCQISPGKSGACDRYANVDGQLIRVDPVVVLRKTLGDSAGRVIPLHGTR